MFGILKKIQAQVNPFDGGATFKNPAPARVKVQAPSRVSRNIPINVGLSDPVQQSGNVGNINQRPANPDNEGVLGLDLGPDLRRGARLAASTAQQFGSTPEFRNIIERTRPMASSEARTVGGLTGGKAGGLYFPKQQGPKGQTVGGRIWAQDSHNGPQILQHEGLHAKWDNTPAQEQQAYLEMLQKVLPANTSRYVGAPWKPIESGPRVYLDRRTANYKGRTGSTQDVRTMNPDIQNELHSYIPEYYEDNPREQMPAELAQYYSRYFQPGAYGKGQRFAHNISRATRPIGNILSRISGDY